MSGFYETMNTCISYAQSSGTDEHPLLKRNRQAFDPISITAILTISFTLIHPLRDGNGRTHRLMIHYLLEQFDVVDSWLIPVSVIILHDNTRTSANNKVLNEVSDPLVRRTKYRFEDGELLIENATRVFFETWDATGAVEYMFHLMDKATRLSIDCGLYIVVWDSCVRFLATANIRVAHSHLKTVIGRYLQTGKVSKNTVKKLAREGIPEEIIMKIAEICHHHLKNDPVAFKDHFEPFNPGDFDEIELNYPSIPPPDEYGFASV
jgi:hypothetical protein